MMIISLTGYMGCGKSSVGRRLSELLCCRFIDLDEVVEARAGKSVSEIFEEDGEAAFRSLELESLKGILCEESHVSDMLSQKSFEGDTAVVLALGGGTVMTEECAELVRENTCCIYLRATVETLLEHLSGKEECRPMLKGGILRERVNEHMSKRSSIYEKTANIIIDTDGKSIEQICSEIVRP
jgi:shikimate kinase